MKWHYEVHPHVTPEAQSISCSPIVIEILIIADLGFCTVPCFTQEIHFQIVKGAEQKTGQQFIVFSGQTERELP